MIFNLNFYSDLDVNNCLSHVNIVQVCRFGLGQLPQAIFMVFTVFLNYSENKIFNILRIHWNILYISYFYKGCFNTSTICNQKIKCFNFSQDPFVTESDKFLKESNSSSFWSLHLVWYQYFDLIKWDFFLTKIKS